MDFPTRDRYRHAIEEFARGSRHSELEVARRAIRATGREKRLPRSDGYQDPRREEDPGYFLISLGRRRFEKELRFRSPPSQWLIRGTAQAGLSGYLRAIALLTTLIVAPPLVSWRTPVLTHHVLLSVGWPCAPASDGALAL